MNTYKKIRGLLAEAKQNIPKRGFVQQHRADTRGEGQPKGAFSVQMAKDAMSIDAEKDELKKQDRMRNFVSKFGSAVFRTKRKAHSKKMKDAGITEGTRHPTYPTSSDKLKKKLADQLKDANFKARQPGATPEEIRQSQQAASVFKAVVGKHRKTKVRSKRHASQSDTGKYIKPKFSKRAPKAGHTQSMFGRKNIAASTEINMNGYDRIYEMLLGEEHGMPSRNYPGHEKRMKGHMDRIQNDPRFKEPDQAAKDRGKKGAEVSNKKQSK